MKRVERRWFGAGTPGAAAMCVLLALGTAAEAAAQEEQVVPRIPAGVKVAVVPVQGVVPLPSGAWPGGASSRADARSMMSSELTFALSESEAARRWAGPEALVRMLERNPTMGTDPRQLAVRSLATLESGEGRLPGPLHSQLRQISALAGVRLVVIPLALEWRSAEAGTPEAADSAGAEERGAAEHAGRAVLRLALVDTRAGLLLWRGELAGQPSQPDSPAALATLASGVVTTLVP